VVGFLSYVDPRMMEGGLLQARMSSVIKKRRKKMRKKKHKKQLKKNRHKNKK